MNSDFSSLPSKSAGGEKRAIREKAIEAAPEIDDTNERPTMADLLISDKAIAEAQGSVPMGEVLDYLRYQWQASEWSATRYANKSEPEIEIILKRETASNFAWLKMLMPSVVRPPWPDWLDAILYPGEARKISSAKKPID